MATSLPFWILDIFMAITLAKFQFFKKFLLYVVQYPSKSACYEWEASVIKIGNII